MTTRQTVSRTDHSRGCGEHRCIRFNLAYRRIIPADAGSTRLPRFSCNDARDHPRGCGEHYFGVAQRRRRLGSSPRMRGAQRSDQSTTGIGGIIPADAGSTGTHGAAAAPARDHPRGCGEHRLEQVGLPVHPGSSPRMRGARSGMASTGRAVRIIPADAGSTSCLSASRASRRDHPRGCGEHPCGTVSVPSFLGSSPRMRGAPRAPRS